MKKNYIKPELFETIYFSIEKLALSGKFDTAIYSENDESIDWAQLFK